MYVTCKLYVRTKDQKPRNMTTNLVLVSVADKEAAKRTRKVEEQNYTKALNRRMSELGLSSDDIEAAKVGCGSMFCSLFSRVRKHQATRVATTAADATQYGVAQSSTRLFGINRGSTASEKLEKATDQMRIRVQEVDKRVSDAKNESRLAFQRGDKAQAVRMLRKAKASEKQQATAVAALEALERQVDLLAESQLNKEIANALSATAASVKKKTKGLVDKADKAVDDTAELKDFAEDMNSALGGLHVNDDYDDEELMEELKDMVSVPPDPPTSAAQPDCSADAKLIRDKHAEWDELQSIRASFPDAPQNGPKAQERASLLAQ